MNEAIVLLAGDESGEYRPALSCFKTFVDCFPMKLEHKHISDHDLKMHMMHYESLYKLTRVGIVTQTPYLVGVIGIGDGNMGT